MVSKGGKITISLVVVLLTAVALIAWYVWRKRFAERKSQSIKPAGTEETCAHVDEDDEANYKESDYDNLELQHSTLDVHKCNSVACRSCTPIGDAPSVHFMKVLKEEKVVKEDVID